MQGQLSIEQVIQEIRKSWVALIFLITVPIIACVVYLHTSEKIYGVEALLRPLPNDGGAIPKGLGGLAGLANISLPAGAEQDRFDFFFEMLFSQPISDRLAQNDALMSSIFSAEWSQKRAEWVKPSNLGYRMKAFLKRLLTGDRQEWSRPDAARLKKYIGLNFEVVDSRGSSGKIVRGYSKYPEVDQHLLEALLNETDLYLRKMAITRYDEYIGYLQDKLALVTVSEYRDALIDVISQQETSRMLAGSSTGFAAEVLIAPTISSNHIRPRASMSLILSALLGALLASIFVVVKIGRHADSGVDAHH